MTMAVNSYGNFRLQLVPVTFSEYPVDPFAGETDFFSSAATACTPLSRGVYTRDQERNTCVGQKAARTADHRNAACKFSLKDYVAFTLRVPIIIK